MVGIEGSISESLDALFQEVQATPRLSSIDTKITRLIWEELERGRKDNSYPLKPQRIVADIRTALGEEDIVLVDTGAVKMWMARLYPTYRPNTCLISNGLSTMAFAFPGAISAKLAFPERKVLAAVGDAGFLMNSQELETAVREKIPVVVLVWVDGSYGLIKWKMDIELGHHSHVDFGNPDFVKLAESYGAKGYAIKRTEDLLPTPQRALMDNTISVIACPVDYAQNMVLTEKLGELTQPL
jgi:acetolactate synthase-1/2/3 large subunit